MLLHVRKALAGSSSHGYTWDADGAVVQVPYDVAVELAAIPDGGFSIVEAPDEPEAAPEAVAEPDVPAAVTEPAPADGQFSEAPAQEPEKPAAAKKAAARKAPATVKE
jgi:hypothetical protein